MQQLFKSTVDSKKDMMTFMIESILFASAGLLLGVLVDKQFDKLRQSFPGQKLLLIVLQLLFLVSLVALMYKFVPGGLVSHFQITLPGMAFPAMFFGVQSSLFTAAQSM